MTVINLNETNFNKTTATGVTLVDFYADWCGPCQRLKPILNNVAERLTGKVTVAKVNIDESMELAKKYNVRSVPTLLVIKDGKVVNRQTGMKTERQLMEFVEAGNKRIV